MVANAAHRSALSVRTRAVPCAHTGLRNVMLNEILHKPQILLHNNLMSSQLNLNLKHFVYPGHAQRLNKGVNIIIPKVNLHCFICVAGLILLNP